MFSTIMFHPSVFSKFTTLQNIAKIVPYFWFDFVNDDSKGLIDNY